jgi:transcription antitermination factor NusB
MTFKTQKFTNARLNAVQCLYMREFTNEPADTLIPTFLTQKIGCELLKEDENGRETFIPMKEKDEALFAKIVQTACEKKEDLDKAIHASLTDEWNKDRLETLLQCILRAGMAEFYVQPDLDAPVIINEYTDITRCFFDGAEINMVNAVLDRFSKVLRG